MKNWAQLSQLTVFGDLIPRKISQSSVWYGQAITAVSHIPAKAHLLSSARTRTLLNSMVESTQLIFKSLTSYNLTQLCSHFLWFSSVLSRLRLVCFCFLYSGQRDSLTRSPEEQKWGCWALHWTQREHTCGECLHPRGFIFLHLRICIPELYLPREGNMPGSMEHLLRHWYYWDVWGSLESGWQEPDDSPEEICRFKKWHLWKPSKNIRNVLEQMACEEYWSKTIFLKNL